MSLKQRHTHSPTSEFVFFFIWHRIFFHWKVETNGCSQSSSKTQSEGLALPLQRRRNSLPAVVCIKSQLSPLPVSLDLRLLGMYKALHSLPFRYPSTIFQKNRITSFMPNRITHSALNAGLIRVWRQYVTFLRFLSVWVSYVEAHTHRWWRVLAWGGQPGRLLRGGHACTVSSGCVGPSSRVRASRLPGVF